jgi:ribonuclease HI
MKEDERRTAAARLLTRLATDEALDRVAGAIGDMDRREAQELLRFAAGILSPAGDQGGRELTIHVDGASIGNPGPAGAGVVFLDGRGKTAETIAQFLGTATNNVAEYRALILGLSRARELGAARVHVRTDSELMVKQVTGEYRIKDEKLVALAHEALELIDSFDSFEIAHVGREENRQADRLAKRAAEARGR